MEKMFVSIVAIFVMYFFIGYSTILWSRFAAGVEILGYFDDGSYDPSEKQFHTTLKRLEHARRVQKGWVLVASIMLVIMTSGVLVPVTEISQVIGACVMLVIISSVFVFGLLVTEQILADVLRKRLVSRYQNKLAEMPHQF